MWEEYEQFCAQKTEQKIGWEHPVFDAIRDKIREEKNFIDNPFTIEEGVMQCHGCKSFKTYSYQKQCRSADEGFSTFVSCFECGAQRREN